MAASVAKARPSMPVHSLDARLEGIAVRCAKASIAINSPGDVAVLLVFETLAAIGVSQKEAAITMGIDESQLSRIKRGEARLPVDALWRLSDVFWAEFRRRVDAAKGLTDEHEEQVYAEQVGALVTLLLKHRARRTA